jgi:hypothetical protein
MKCKKCGKNCDGEYCFQHKARKPLSSGKGLTSKKMFNSSNKASQSNNDGYKLQMSTISNKKTNSVQDNRHILQREMFLNIWKKRPHKSEVSGDYLGKEPMSTYFHHILPKEKYPEACLDEENIILLTLEEHSNVENDMYRYEEVNERRKQLNLKYNERRST